MKKHIDGKKYDTKTSQYIGGFPTSDNLLFCRRNGQYFLLSRNENLVPMTIFETIKWSMSNLSNADFENEFGASKNDFVSLAGGSVEHERRISKENGTYIQDDILTTRIPFHALELKSRDLLDYWGVDDFDYAYIINGEKPEIVLDYKTSHPLPKRDALEALEDPSTINDIHR